MSKHNSKTERLSIRLSEKELKNLEIYCKKYHKKKSDVARFALSFVVDTTLEQEAKRERRLKSKKGN